MTLAQLHLHPNPFLKPTFPLTKPYPRPLLPHHAKSRPIHPLPRTIPLVELALRALVSHHVFPELDPAPGDSMLPPDANDTILAVHYPLPLEQWDIPQPLRSILESCVPDTATYSSTEGPPDFNETGPSITGVGVCPSPRHDRRSVFVQHAEELFTWENRIAGVSVGGAVPLRWRGCQWGCLNFLDPELVSDHGEGEMEDNADGPSDDHRDAERGGGNDEPEVVQLLHLSLAGGFDEFD